MIKVLSGKYKNRKLKFFDNPNIRPTQSRVKKSLFDTIHDLEGKKVLDLFCGVGTLGIEAISRGAKSVKFVDNNRKAIAILKQNLSLLSIDSEQTIINSDVMKFISNEEEKYDLILADPPYHKFNLEDFLPSLSSNMLNNGIFCYETGKHEHTDNLELKIKKFGSTQLIFWRKNV